MNVILYFNDTKWEHPDLYRFLDDLQNYFDHPVFFDSDGRDPEQLFYDEHSLANNRMPFCSKILKAKRLQNFYENGDEIIFGIGHAEKHRARRIVKMYQHVSYKKKKQCTLKFPMIIEKTTVSDIDDFLQGAGIKQPLLYDLGFHHNNCSGGCVRAGKKQWKMLYEKLPGVYADRERVENDFRKQFDKDVHFFKDETLEHFRHRIENGELSSHYFQKQEQLSLFECVGVCSAMA